MNNYYELRFESITNLHSLGLVCEDKVINALNRKSPPHLKPMIHRSASFSQI